MEKKEKKFFLIKRLTKCLLIKNKIMEISFGGVKKDKEKESRGL